MKLLAIVAEETDALMITVGSRGEGPGKVFDRILQRWSPTELLAHQHRPVLVVPPPEGKPDAPAEPGQGGPAAAGGGPA